MLTKNQSISVMIVPPGDRKTISLKIGMTKIYFLGALLVILNVILISFLLNYGNLLRKANQVEKLKIEKQKLAEENQKVKDLATELANLKSMEEKILKMTTSQINSDYTITQAELAEVYKNEKELSFKPNLDKFVSDKNNDEFSEIYSKQQGLMKTIPSLNPVEKSWISQGYTDNHKGIDLAAPMFTPIKAAAEGEIIFAGEKKDLGNLLIIDHHNGYQSKYGHTHRFTVKTGDFVSKGDIIAFLGNSGNSSAPHLHFEVIKDGQNIDPLTLIKISNDES